MLTFAQLHDLQGRLRSRKVLSVFVDTSGGSSWRGALNRALARLDAVPPHLSSGERTARELCMAHLRTALEGMRGTPGQPGWFAYVTTDDVVAAGPVGSRLEAGVFWQNGIVMGPLLSALATPRAVTLAEVGGGEVAGAQAMGTGGIAATRRFPPVATSSANATSHAAPA